MSVSATVAKATIDNESINEIIKQFTHDLTQRQKDIVALMTRVTELEASLGEREAEIAALKAGTDGEKMERFLKEKQALVRDQNKLALDRARLSAQASNWVEKLGQVQEGLCQYLPPQNTSLEKEADSEGT